MEDFVGSLLELAFFSGDPVLSQARQNRNAVFSWMRAKSLVLMGKGSGNGCVRGSLEA